MTRIRELDALRGFAVGGIMLVNTWQHVPKGDREPLDSVMLAAFQGRFYPIFSLLFGIGFVLFLRTGTRVALLRRLAVLLAFGLMQHTFYDGEVLTDYAAFGAAILLPASFLTPGVPVLLLGLAGLGWGVWQGGGTLIIPGLFLIGMALIQLRPDRRLLLPFFAVSTVATLVLSVFWHTSQIGAFSTLAAVTGAAAYGTGLLLILRPRLSAVLEPLGRLALTNYVSGTLVIFLTAPLIGESTPRWWVPVIAGLTVAAQIVFSRWWLRRYRYGPLEWIWRCLTWYRRVPNRLESNRDHHRPVSDPGLP
ncbi:DUF418 domain-containing protein [Nonomuraea typhae]|uniref:DUF418 domain-containing protein n=1 Tax=Nonomuraea typhae TaxID=2603600 RepID=A0ABW7YPA9_9ACTN